MIPRCTSIKSGKSTLGAVYFLIILCVNIGAQEGPKTLDDYKTVFEAQVQKIKQDSQTSLEPIFQAYRAKVEQLRVRYQEQGNLEVTALLVAELSRIDDASLNLVNSNEEHHNAHVGHAYDGAGYVWFKGMLDEVMIWNCVLSESEVKELYELHRQ